MASAKLSAITNISVPAVSDLLYGAQGGVEKSYPLDRLLGFGGWGIAQGRLTLTTGVPITTSDVTGATTIYFTPFGGNLVAVYDGTRIKLYTFSELSVALGTLTNATLYDVFLWDTSGLALKIGPAWSNSGAGTSARGTGAGTTELERFNGVLVNKVSIASGPAARAGLYLGSFLTTATTTTEDSNAKRFLWNAYNPVARGGAVDDDTHSHVVNATTQEWNAGTALRVNFVVGQVGVRVPQYVSAQATMGAFVENMLFWGALNGTTAETRYQLFQPTLLAAQAVSYNVWVPVLGFNYVTAVEQSANANNITFDLGRNRVTLFC